MRTRAVIVAIFLGMTGRAWADADATQRVAAARAQIGVTVEYDPAYTKLAYPGGDVPLKTGVCCDVVIRALRKQGRDLQQLVHEDMRKHFVLYPQKWGLQKPDANIDHRRGLNLACYFQRQGWSVGISTQPAAYLPGDIVTWDLGHGLTHIGIVSDRQSVQATPLVIHNIGRGAREEDLLFRFTITGHYRPSKTENPAPPAAAPARAGPHVLRSESTAAPGGSK